MSSAISAFEPVRALSTPPPLCRFHIPLPSPMLVPKGLMRTLQDPASWETFMERRACLVEHIAAHRRTGAHTRAPGQHSYDTLISVLQEYEPDAAGLGIALRKMRQSGDLPKIDIAWTCSLTTVFDKPAPSPPDNSYLDHYMVLSCLAYAHMNAAAQVTQRSEGITEHLVKACHLLAVAAGIWRHLDGMLMVAQTPVRRTAASVYMKATGLPAPESVLVHSFANPVDAGGPTSLMTSSTMRSGDSKASAQRLAPLEADSPYVARGMAALCDAQSSELIAYVAYSRRNIKLENIAKLAKAAADHYSAAGVHFSRLANDSSLFSHERNFLRRYMLAFITIKYNLNSALTARLLAEVSYKVNIGLSVGYLQVVNSFAKKAAESQKGSDILNVSPIPANDLFLSGLDLYIRSELSTASSLLASLKRENELVYMVEVPSEEDLPSTEGTSIVKTVNFVPTAPRPFPVETINSGDGCSVM
ncbi:hypothetical protein H696_03957 [Fonticula alba]|uniref:BRO1 domain-containing protein n=1 Tax=Fonticula alba TaxID=691883 RepID=A0A058Z7Q9_FONAL|nr:hypothetical protein H696_03957 [Fonticula alba]KCV69537.1 hypothetical protein H696_03957 [Fonticula alba]|eukprot:XP_009496102.1 hypothetical protein H696_03957 [Fonticula alba]